MSHWCQDVLKFTPAEFAEFATEARNQEVSTRVACELRYYNVWVRVTGIVESRLDATGRPARTLRMAEHRPTDSQISHGLSEINAISPVGRDSDNMFTETRLQFHFIKAIESASFLCDRALK